MNKLNLIFHLTDHNIYKTFTFLLLNYILIEGVIAFAKYVFGLETLLGIFDFMVSIGFMGLFYYLSYRLAVLKSKE